MATRTCAVCQAFCVRPCTSHTGLRVHALISDAHPTALKHRACNHPHKQIIVQTSAQFSQQEGACIVKLWEQEPWQRTGCSLHMQSQHSTVLLCSCAHIPTERQKWRTFYQCYSGEKRLCGYQATMTESDNGNTGSSRPHLKESVKLVELYKELLHMD